MAIILKKNSISLIVMRETENDKWVEVKMISRYTAFRSTMYKIRKFSSVVIEENWADIYGSLEKGEYRYIKELYVDVINSKGESQTKV
jgi:hypothetical protein